MGVYLCTNRENYTISNIPTTDINFKKMFHHELKNAYIGGYYEYSYDFRNSSTSQITSDGWSYSA
jgi:hypothetical protein